MPDLFIDVDIETDASTLQDNAIGKLQNNWPDWDPHEGDLEVVQLEVVSDMASDAAGVAAEVPAAVFTTVLTDLHGIAKEDGQPATTTVTFHLTDATAHLVPEGFEIDIDGFAFTVDDNLVTGASTVPGVPVTCTVNDDDANGLTGDVVDPITALAFVTSITVDAPTANGVDPEDDDDFLDRGVELLQLQATTLVTTHDYALMCMAQSYIGRVTVTANTSTRTVDITPSEPDGDPLSSTEKTELLTLLNDYRLTNWTIVIHDPTIVTINVAFTVRPYMTTPLTFDPADLVDRCVAEVEAFLNPATWGQPTGIGGVANVENTWLFRPVVHVNKIIDLLGNVQDVDWVETVVLSGGTDVVINVANGDATMSGTMPLASAGSIDGTVDVVTLIPDFDPIPAPEGTSFNDLLLQRFAPWLNEDLQTYLEAIAGMFSEVELFAFETANYDGWTILVDPDRCPAKALPYLGQYVGAVFPTGTTEAEMRERIKDRANMRRGTPRSVFLAAQRRLTGARLVTLYERSPDVDHIEVYTYTDQTADPVGTERDILSVLPTDVILTYDVRDGQTWRDVKDNYATWAAVKAAGSWAAIQSHQAGTSTYGRPVPPPTDPPDAGIA